MSPLTQGLNYRSACDVTCKNNPFRVDVDVFSDRLASRFRVRYWCSVLLQAQMTGILHWTCINLINPRKLFIFLHFLFINTASVRCVFQVCSFGLECNVPESIAAGATPQTPPGEFIAPHTPSWIWRKEPRKLMWEGEGKGKRGKA